jgi:hypothetical protein
MAAKILLVAMKVRRDLRKLMILQSLIGELDGDFDTTNKTPG